MKHQKAYTITRSNNSTEKEAIEYLLNENSNFILPDKESRKNLMEIFNIDKRFSRAFDLIYIKDAKPETHIFLQKKEDIIFIELKTTKKKLPNNPRGFFFGATENEFNLAKQLGNKYKFCFVSLHKESVSYALLSQEELEKLIKNKRIQYQINLEN